MILKPARLTPLTAQYFAQTMLDAGLPAGVLNVVASATASAVSDPLLADSRLRKLSFTGSTPVGKALLKSAAQNVLRTSMELGGNAPFIVFEDANIDEAVEGAMGAKMRNMGEACTAANRFLVHESRAEEFSTKLATKISNLDRGAQALVGGYPQDGPGYFYQPTVLINVPHDARVIQEEIFGPVAPIITFSTEEEAIQLANNTEYGLASYVYTTDTSRALRTLDRLEVGMTGLNIGIMSNAAAPFGGVKHSGLGREGAAEGIAEYTYTQYIGIKDPYAS